MSRTVSHLKDDLFPVSDFRFCVIVYSEKEKSCALLLLITRRAYTHTAGSAHLAGPVFPGEILFRFPFALRR